MPRSVPSPVPNEPAAPEELRQILLQRIVDFDLSLSNLYPKRHEAGPALEEYNDLNDRYIQAGGSAKELNRAIQAKTEQRKEQEREKFRALISAGKLPPVPPCPQYYKDDAGCGWENAWFDHHVRKELLKLERKAPTGV